MPKKAAIPNSTILTEIIISVFVLFSYFTHCSFVRIRCTYKTGIAIIQRDEKRIKPIGLARDYFSIKDELLLLAASDDLVVS
jgi:hypothetical protein